MLLDSPAVALGDDIANDATLAEAADSNFHSTGIATAFDTILPEYLAAEKQAGRVGPAADEQAFGFVIVGATHAADHVIDTTPPW